MLTTVSGYYVEPTAYGTATEFVLQTTTGLVRICCKAAPPLMRQDDVICVVLWNNEVLSISNFGTGTEIRYHVLTPNGPYWREHITLGHAFCLALLILVMDCAAFGAGLSYSMTAIRDVQVPSLLFLAAATYGVLMWCIFHRAIVTQHNAKVADAIQKRTIAASSVLCRKN